MAPVVFNPKRPFGGGARRVELRGARYEDEGLLLVVLATAPRKNVVAILQGPRPLSTVVQRVRRRGVPSLQATINLLLLIILGKGRRFSRTFCLSI